VLLHGEEGPDLSDVVESKSTRWGHRGDVGVAGQLVIQFHARFLAVGPGETSMSSMVTSRSI